MSTKRILIVEDERDIAELLAYNLKKEGFETQVCFSGEQARTVLLQQEVQAVLLDIMLPGIDGLELCRWLRQQPKLAHIFVIIVSAKSAEIDRILGLEIGADDYISKPFSPREVVARLKAVFRRDRITLPGEQDPVLTAGPVHIDRGRHVARIDGQDTPLTKIEFDLFECLATQPGYVFTRQKLLQHVWGYDFYGDDRVVDVHIRRLRLKLKKVSKFDYVHTVHGVGYKFQLPATGALKTKN